MAARSLASLALALGGCGGAIVVDGGGPVDAAATDAALDLSAVALDAAPEDAGDGCPPGMAHFDGFCVDRWEAHVVAIDDAGVEAPHSPYLVVDDLTVRAKTAPGVVPQGYISQLQASAACEKAGKRLCTAAEFALACRGADPADWYPYGGQTLEKGYCNQDKGSSVARFFGNDPSKWTYQEFNDPRLNQWDGGLAPTGSYPHCVSPAGVWDCVGNLHEWGADAADAKGHGRFRGGFYGDAEVNGHGCRYVTSAHELSYHDYSTGFRCCRDSR